MISRFIFTLVAGAALAGAALTPASAQSGLCPLTKTQVATICTALAPIQFLVLGTLTGAEGFNLCVCPGNLAMQCGGKPDPCRSTTEPYQGGYTTVETKTGEASCMWYKTDVRGFLKTVCLRTPDDPTCVCR